MPANTRNRRGGPIVLALCSALFCLGVRAASTDARVISKVAPEFPREALQAGADKGRVKARMTVSGTGEVTRVEILEAQPRRIFDRAVVKTLALWRFDNGADNRAVEVDVEFQR